MPLDQNCRDLTRFLVQMRGDAALEFAQRLADESSSPTSESSMAWRNVGKAIEYLMDRTDRRRWTDRSPR